LTQKKKKKNPIDLVKLRVFWRDWKGFYLMKTREEGEKAWNLSPSVFLRGRRKGGVESGCWCTLLWGEVRIYSRVPVAFSSFTKFGPFFS
jgi:hypothetical protein